MSNAAQKKKISGYVIIVVLVLAIIGVGIYDVMQLSKASEKETVSAEVEKEEVPTTVTTEGGATVVLYEGPMGIEPAMDRVVTVEGKPVFVYDTEINTNRSWSQEPSLLTTPVAYFDFEGTVEVKVQAPGETITSAVVRPLSLGIQPTIEGDTITFTVSQPGPLTIELNDSTARSLHLFANPLEVNAPKEGDENVIYLGPGVHNAEAIVVKSNQTVYIAGGAVINGVIRGENVENVKVIGRGIIDGSNYDRWPNAMVPMDFRHCKNVTVEGIIFLNPAGWTLNTYFCDGVTIDNVKIISARSNGDGITTQSCQNFVAKNCFVRSWDDSLVVKDYDLGTAENITFDNIVVWTDLAQSCEIGYETNGATIKNVTFKNITVLHNYHKPVMSIHNTDQAVISDIHYENIVVEDAQMGGGDAKNDGFLIDINIATSGWTTSAERGSVKDVTFENITVLSGKTPPSRIKGYDATHLVENVTIKNLVINGEQVLALGDGKFQTNDYATNVVFE